MHANELNAEKIERGTKENGSYLITIFKKTNEKVQMQKMKPGDIALIVLTQPKYYAGGVGLVRIKEVKDYQINVEFIRYLNRKVPVTELRAIDDQFKAQNHQMILTLTENVFAKIIQREDAKTEII